jgi:hypothetical protein
MHSSLGVAPSHLVCILSGEQGRKPIVLLEDGTASWEGEGGIV